jgi:hypothetical protein
LKVQQYDARTCHNISTIQEKCDGGLLLQRKKEGSILQDPRILKDDKRNRIKNIEAYLSDVTAYLSIVQAILTSR